MTYKRWETGQWEKVREYGNTEGKFLSTQSGTVVSVEGFSNLLKRHTATVYKFEEKLSGSGSLLADGPRVQTLRKRLNLGSKMGTFPSPATTFASKCSITPHKGVSFIILVHMNDTSLQMALHRLAQWGSPSSFSPPSMQPFTTFAHLNINKLYSSVILP